MKTAMIARFVLGAGAIFAVAGLAGCGAGEQGSGDPVGSSEQAIALSLATGYAAKAPAYLTTPSNGLLLQAGGFSASGSSAIPTVKTFAYAGGTGTWAALNSLHTARGNAKIAPIPGQTGLYLVVGGNTNSSSSLGTLKTAEIIDVPNNRVTAITDAIGKRLASPRIKFEMVPCGDKLLVIAGKDGSSEVDTLEVFTYVAGGVNDFGKDSTFETMKNADDHSTVVTLNTARYDFGAQAMSSSRIVVFGGKVNAGTLLSSTEILTVNSACELVDNDNNNTATHPAAGPAMPAGRAQFASARVSLTISSTPYEVIVAGGEEASSAPNTTYVYDDDAPAWSSTSTPTISAGRVAPMLATNGVGTFALVGGVNFAGTDTVSNVDLFASNAFSSATLTDARFLGGAAYLNSGSTLVAASGSKLVSSSETFLTTTE